MKKIVICCDGTWVNSDGGDNGVPTNVTRIGRALKKVDSNGINQVFYYQAGVGTMGGFIGSFLGGGTGFGLSENVREAYGFLSHNYHVGDTIHLFGFSRGAYTARSVCGLICNLGILTKKGMDDFYEIYNDYRSRRLKEPGYVDKLEARPGGPRVIRNVKVTTIGCWDTVGSLGIPTIPIPYIGKWITGANAEKFGFHETDISPLVENAFHALSLDEHRSSFAPTLWHKTPDNDVTNLQQVYFPGVHTNVGGGYENQEIADMTLGWMIENVSPWLEFSTEYLHTIIKNGSDCDSEWAAGHVYNSATGMMRLNAGSPRTPGRYGEGTFEAIHCSARVRMRVVKGWESHALKGWEWDDDEGVWRMGDLVLPEAPLGELERFLGGEHIVGTLLEQAKVTRTGSHDLLKGDAMCKTTVTSVVENGNGVSSNGLEGAMTKGITA